MNQYCSQWINKGFTGALSPDDAIQLSYELEMLCVIFLGVELWYINENGHIIENYWDDFTVDAKIIPDAPQRTGELCRLYIQNDMPKNIAYVSFVLGGNIPIEWLDEICQ